MKKILLVVLATIILLVVVAFFAMGSIIKGGVEMAGSKATGTDVTLGTVIAMPLAGNITFNNFKIANPEGYNSPHAINLDKIHVDLDSGSVFTDTVVISEISIIAPDINYEIGSGGTNINRLRKNIKANTASTGSKKKDSDEDAGQEKQGKKLVIEHLHIKQGKVTFNMNVPGVDAMSIDLPDIHLKDIGKEGGESKGATMEEVMERVMGSLERGIAEVNPSPLKGNIKDLQEGIKDKFKKLF